MKPSKAAELAVRDAIEAQGFVVHQADILFDANCPNIDLVAFGKTRSKYIQVKLSSKPSRKDAIVIDGMPWTQGQLAGLNPVFNRHAHAFVADLIVVAHQDEPDQYTFYVAPPKVLQRLLLPLARAYAKKPKRDGGRRKMFRKEVPRAKLQRYRGAWEYLGAP